MAAATTKDKGKRPALKNLDDLFNLNDGINPLEQSIPIMATQPRNARTVVSMKIELLMPFEGHPFRLYEGERLDDMVASIKANGILVPLIVRKVDTVLEILAGHNRANAAKLAGHNEVPIIIKSVKTEFWLWQRAWGLCAPCPLQCPKHITICGFAFSITPSGGRLHEPIRHR